MRLVGLSPEAIALHCLNLRPEIPGVLARARAAVPVSKREVWPHQAAALYCLAAEHARRDAICLEIGTAYGYSASILAQAMPDSWIVTLNPKESEYPEAAANLRAFGNATVLPERSADYLAEYAGPAIALVFVDGSHSLEDVRADALWWRWLEVGGLILFHDYSPGESRRPSPEAKQAADELGARLGRGPDVLVVDDALVGMCGWVKREGE